MTWLEEYERLQINLERAAISFLTGDDPNGDALTEALKRLGTFRANNKTPPTIEANGANATNDRKQP